MTHPLLHRLILREFALPFAFSILSLSFLFLFAKLFSYLQPLLMAGVTLTEFLRFTLLLIPMFLAVLVPISVMIGVLVAFIRLSQDCEAIALFACGIGPKQMASPLFVIAASATAATLLIYATVVPYAKRHIRAFKNEVTEKGFMRGLPEKHFFSPQDNFTFYINESYKKGKKFKGIFIRDSRDQDLSYYILARKGHLAIEPASRQVVLNLFSGRLVRISGDYGEMDNIKFRKYLLSLTSKEVKRGPRKGEMSLSQLWKAMHSPEVDEKHRRKYQIEFHKRFGIPAGAFIVVFLSAPLGIFFGRTGMAAGIFSGVASFLAYYMAIIAGSSLATNGIIPPAAGIWVPDALFALAASALYVQLMKRGPNWS